MEIRAILSHVESIISIWYGMMNYMRQSIGVYQATHSKRCTYVQRWMRPIQVGAKGKPSIEEIRDDRDENISDKNPMYCELTALYWLWKNSEEDITGLCHYRRIFRISESQIKHKLERCDFIVAPHYNYRYTLEEEYSQSHIEKDWKLMTQILQEYYPDYYKASLSAFQHNRIYPYNMFIAKRETTNTYCKWLFDVLEKIEQKTDEKNRDTYQIRYIGFLAERLFTLYLFKNQCKIAECKLRYDRKNEALYQLKLRIWSFINNIFFKVKHLFIRNENKKKNI